MPGKTLPFRLYAQILIFSALVALGAAILWPLQRAVQGGMLGIRDGFITQLEQQIGRKIRYSSISPSIFGSFDVRNVRIMGENEHPVLTISRFRIAYSLPDLLRGSPQGIHSVWVDTPLIDFNVLYDQDLLDLFTSFNTGEGSFRQNFAQIFPEQFIARIRNGKCLVFNGRDHFEFEIPNLNVEISGDRIIVDGRWTIGLILSNPVGMPPVSLHAAMRASGSMRTDLEEGEAVFSIPAITGDAFSASQIAFGLVLENRMLRLGKMPDNLKFDLFFEYGLDSGTIDTQLDCTDFKLGDFLSFSGGLEGARQILDIAGSGRAFLERDHDGGLGYLVNLYGQADGASFAIKFTGDEARAHIETLQFSMLEAVSEKPLFLGYAGFSGSLGFQPFAPAGTLLLNNFSLSGTETLTADISFSTRNDGEVRVWCDALNLGRVELNALNALLRNSGDTFNFDVSALNFSKAGSFALEGSMHSVLRHLEAKLRLDSFAVGDIAGMALPFVKNVSIPAPLKGLLSGTAVTTEIVFATDFEHLSYNAPRFVVAGTMGKGFDGLFSMSGTGSYFELSEGHFSWGGDTVTLSGMAEFPSLADINFSLNAAYRSMEYHIDGGILDGKSVDIKGSHGLAVAIAESNNRGYTGSMYAEGFPVPFLGYPAFLSFAAQIRYDTAASWTMNLDHLDLTNIAGPTGMAQIRVSGSADQNGADFPLLYYRDKLGPLSGRADISWLADYSGFSGAAGLGEGAEQYIVEGSYSEGQGSIAFSGSSMQLERAFGSKVSVFADGNILVTWDGSAQSDDYFHVELNLPSAQGKLFDQSFGARARLVLTNEALVVSGLHFTFSGIEGVVPYFRMNALQGTIESGAEITGFAGKTPVEGNLLLAAHFSPIRSWVGINEIANSFNGKLHFNEFMYGNEEAQNFDINFSRSHGAFSLMGGPREMIRFRMDQGGDFYGGLSSPSPVRGTIIGSIKGGIINARAGDLYLDMAELFNMLPGSENFYLTGGYVSASLDIRGSLSDPEFFGTARGTSLRIQVPNFIAQELRPIPFNVAIDGNEIRFGPVSTAVGSGAGTVRGWFRIDRWIPNIFSIDVSIPRETPIPYGLDISGFVARGDAAGNLNISMENLTFDISGDLYANNTEMGIDTEEISRSRRGSSAARRFPIVVDLMVSTGPVVEFFYPTSRFPILRANPDMGTRLHITADTLAQQYSLNSDVRIRGGEIFYFERRFYIRSGTLLLRENELRFDPRLTARAEVRDRTEDGPVTISMIVDNAPLRSFTARFESTPPLSQMEIYALLGHTLTGAQYDQNADSLQRAFLNSGSELLAQYIVGRQLEQQIRNFMGLDMFNVRTHVLQNAFLMSTGLLQQPVDRNGRVGNYFDNTTVFGGKYIGQDMFVQGMLSMRYDANRESTGGLTFVPDLGVELQSPLFSIRWDFAPTHPENWYVNDNSITLTWSRTF